MKPEKLEALISAVAGVARFTSARLTDPPYATYGAVAFVGSGALRVLRERLEELGKDGLFGGFSQDWLRTRLLKSVDDLLRPCPKLSVEQHARRFQEDAEGEEERDWLIARPLLGAVVSDEVDLGVLRLARSDSFLRALTEADQFLAGQEPSQIWGEAPPCVAVVKAVAREGARAVELADEVFANAENLIRFFVADLSEHRSVGILDYHTPDKLHFFGYSAPGLTTQGDRRTGAVLPFDLSSLPAPGDEDGLGRLWGLLEPNALTALQRRTLAAVNWIGRGLNETRRSNAFVQFMFAIEAMLTYQERGVIVTPSIASQLSEACAFLLGESTAGRTELERLTKRLYGTRSSVAHGSDGEVSLEDVATVLELARRLVGCLTLHPEVSALSKIEDLYAWIRAQRYK